MCKYNFSQFLSYIVPPQKVELVYQIGDNLPLVASSSSPYSSHGPSIPPHTPATTHSVGKILLKQRTSAKIACVTTYQGNL